VIAHREIGIAAPLDTVWNLRPLRLRYWPGELT
jgi:hypothetical protein